jgi:hypothetical protein
MAKVLLYKGDKQTSRVITMTEVDKQFALDRDELSGTSVTWSAEMEVALFQAMDKLRPVGKLSEP